MHSNYALVPSCYINVKILNCRRKVRVKYDNSLLMSFTPMDQLDKKKKKKKQCSCDSHFKTLYRTFNVSSVEDNINWLNQMKMVGWDIRPVLGLGLHSPKLMICSSFFQVPTISHQLKVLGLTSISFQTNFT